MKKSPKIKIVLMVLALSSLSPALEPPEYTFEQDGSGYKLVWSGATGMSYFIQYSESLNSWQFFSEIKQGVGSFGYGFSTSETKLFTRLIVTSVPMEYPETYDLDGDGWGNMFEMDTLGTDPFKKDTDADGILDGAESLDGDLFSDAWEMLYFGDLTTVGPGDEYGDLDGDGISNLFESRMRTDPNIDQSTVPVSTSGGAREEFTYTLLGRLEGVAGEKSMSFTFDDEGNIQTAN